MKIIKTCKMPLCRCIGRVCNHVIAVYSENKLQHYATAYRNHKSAGEKLGLFRFCNFFYVKRLAISKEKKADLSNMLKCMPPQI